MKENNTMRWYKFFGWATFLCTLVYAGFALLGIDLKISTSYMMVGFGVT